MLKTVRFYILTELNNIFDSRFDVSRSLLLLRRSIAPTYRLYRPLVLSLNFIAFSISIYSRMYAYVCFSTSVCIQNKAVYW